MRLAIWMAAALTVAGTGCTHQQLRRSAVGQVGSVADIYQQQVLNNLAKFASDPNALPDFGVPTSGLATVTDSAAVGNTYGWSNTALQSIGLSLGGSRGVSQNWSLRPVQDPRKIELMRCAYRRAVGFANGSECCQDCNKRFANFYTGDPCGDVPLSCQGCPVGACNDDDAACKAQKADTGIVTSNCLGSCWFHVGCSSCLDKIRKENPCCLIGEHCGTIVWVCPGRGSDELSKLTIAILDYAVNEPKKKKVEPEATKQIIGYFDAAGNAVPSRDAAYQVTANLRMRLPTGEFNSATTADSLQRALLGPPVTADDIRALPPTGNDTVTPPSPTRSDAYLELLGAPGPQPSTFLPPQ